GAAAVRELLSEATHQVVVDAAAGTEGIVRLPRHRLVGDRVERADRVRVRSLAGELAGGADAAGRPARPDAPRVEQVEVADPEVSTSFDEERALLRELRFEGREIEHRRIRLHLPEVRLEGR